LGGTGIGTALRRARLLRGKSIEEASRETHIRPEYLRALEREGFEAVIGDVYVRGFLRSYSTYLGLDPDQVLGVYNRHFGPARPTLPDPAPGPVKSERSLHAHMPSAMRNHPSWTFLAVVALLAVSVFAAAGLFSRSGASDDLEPPSSTTTIPVLPPNVSVGITTAEPLTATITVDGEKREFELRKDEAYSFEGSREIEVTLSRGGVATVSVNGYSLGTPGKRTKEYSATFGPLDYRSTPSASST
jgi:cytoskeletal protein RodZ